MPRSFGNLCQLHAGLILSQARRACKRASAPPLTVLLTSAPVITQALWSIMHVIISVPLRRGASPVIVALYRECVSWR